jgi:hypothetical protein
MEKVKTEGKITFGLNRLRFSLSLIITVFCFFSPLYGEDVQRPPIDINLIIDGSAPFSGVREEITSWVFERLDQIIVNGDRVTVWNAETEAKIIYSGIINNSMDKETVKRSVREFSASGDSADFSGALREAARRQSSNFSYTLLISASNEALASVLTSPQADLLRYSRIEEFSSWRALVVGLNIDSRVRRLAAAFLGSR